MGIFLLSCLSTFAVIHGVVWYRKQLTMKRLKKVPRSGDLVSEILKVDLSECVEVDVIYEIVNPELKKAIQNLIKIKAKRILLDTRIVIAAGSKIHTVVRSAFPSIIAYGTIEMPLFGVFAPLKSLMLSFAGYGACVAGVAYWVMNYLPVLIVNLVPGAGTLLAAAIISLATLSTPHVQRTLVPLTGTCEQFIRPVPSIEVIDNSGNSHVIKYIDPAFENPSNNVYFYDSEHNKYYNDLVKIEEVEMQLHVKTPGTQSGICEHKQLESLGTQNEIFVKETCTPREYKYIPLRERTMTIADLDKKDNKIKKIIENAQGPIKAYERSSSNYAKKRIKAHYHEQAEYLQNPNKKTDNLSSSSQIDQLLNDFEF
jgi:hypothetical protein